MYVYCYLLLFSRNFGILILRCFQLYQKKKMIYFNEVLLY